MIQLFSIIAIFILVFLDNTYSYPLVVIVDVIANVAWLLTEGNYRRMLIIIKDEMVRIVS